MEFDLSDLLTSFGIYSITLSQILMIGVGFLLLFLAINNKFEPLLLLPIGFGAILTNIPEIGLSYSGLEKLILVNDQLEVEGLLALLGLSEINLYSTSDLTSNQLFMGENFAYDQIRVIDPVFCINFIKYQSDQVLLHYLFLWV